MPFLTMLKKITLNDFHGQTGVSVNPPEMSSFGQVKISKDILKKQIYEFFSQAQLKKVFSTALYIPA